MKDDRGWKGCAALRCTAMRYAMLRLIVCQRGLFSFSDATPIKPHGSIAGEIDKCVGDTVSNDRQAHHRWPSACPPAIRTSARSR